MTTNSEILTTRLGSYPGLVTIKLGDFTRTEVISAALVLHHWNLKVASSNALLPQLSRQQWPSSVGRLNREGYIWISITHTYHPNILSWFPLSPSRLGIAQPTWLSDTIIVAAVLIALPSGTRILSFSNPIYYIRTILDSSNDMQLQYNLLTILFEYLLLSGPFICELCLSFLLGDENDAKVVIFFPTRHITRWHQICKVGLRSQMTYCNISGRWPCLPVENVQHTFICYKCK